MSMLAGPLTGSFVGALEKPKYARRQCSQQIAVDNHVKRHAFANSVADWPHAEARTTASYPEQNTNQMRQMP
jgi:hypothetical protein